MTRPRPTAAFPAPRPARRPDRVRGGFALVEAAIVVVILALLALTVLPQLGGSGPRTADGALRRHLHVLRGQIELYRVQHGNVLPGANGRGTLIEQLMRRTDRHGNVGDGEEHVFGPYLIGDEFPANPATGRHGVTVGAKLPPLVTGETDAGWVYSTATGEFRAQGDAERYEW